MRAKITPFFLFITICILLHPGNLEAQSADITLDLQVDPILTNSQIIELTNFVFDDQGSGPRLMSLRVTNNETTPVDDLYLAFQIVSQKRGMLLEAYQRKLHPFTLSAGQTATATNNTIARSNIPGVSQPIRLEAELTAEGEDLLNSLSGRTTLPVDEYSIMVQIYQGGNRFDGTEVASAVSVVGTNLIEEELSIFLQAPGDVPEAGAAILTQYPEFRWEGITDQTYRVVIVEYQQEDPPETLIQNALSTPGAQISQSTTLLEFEMADVLVNGTNFRYPASGVQPLGEGKQYYWQIFTTLITTSGQETRSSDIWSFTYQQSDQTNLQGGGMIDLDEEVAQILFALLGPQLFGELADGNYRLEGMNLDGVELSGEAARQELMQLIEKIQEGKIKVSNE